MHKAKKMHTQWWVRICDVTHDSCVAPPNIPSTAPQIEVGKDIYTQMTLKTHFFLQIWQNTHQSDTNQKTSSIIFIWCMLSTGLLRCKPSNMQRSMLRANCAMSAERISVPVKGFRSSKLIISSS